MKQIKITIYSIITVLLCFLNTMPIDATETFNTLDENSIDIGEIIALPDGESILVSLLEMDEFDNDTYKYIIMKMNIKTMEKEELLVIDKQDYWENTHFFQTTEGILILTEDYNDSGNDTINLSTFLYRTSTGTLEPLETFENVYNNYGDIPRIEYLNLEGNTLTTYVIDNSETAEIYTYTNDIFLNLDNPLYLIDWVHEAYDTSNEVYRETSFTINKVRYDVCRGTLYLEGQDTCIIEGPEVEREMTKKNFASKLYDSTEDSYREVMISPIQNIVLAIISSRENEVGPQALVVEKEGELVQIQLPFLSTKEEKVEYQFEKGITIQDNIAYLVTEKGIIRTNLQTEQAEMLISYNQIERGLFEGILIEDTTEYPIYEYDENPLPNDAVTIFANIISESEYLFEDNPELVRVVLFILIIAVIFFVGGAKKRRAKIQRKYQKSNNDESRTNQNIDKQIARIRHSTASEDELAIEENKMRNDSKASGLHNNNDQDKQNQKIKKEYDKEIAKFNRKFGGGRW